MKKREGEFDDVDRKRMLLSTETLLGLRITDKFLNLKVMGQLIVVIILHSSLFYRTGQIHIQAAWCGCIFKQKDLSRSR